MYSTPAAGAGSPVTSPNCCMQTPSASKSENVADTLASPSLANVLPSFNVMAWGVKFLNVVMIFVFV
jgi:hypothetical protein